MRIGMSLEKAMLNPRIFLHLKRLMRESELSAARVRQLQFRRLKRLLIGASENFDFYRERFRSARFDPHGFSDIAELERLPVLTKQEYRDFSGALHSARPEAYQGWYEDATSGSTGTALRIWRTWDERAYMLAKWMRALYLNGYGWRDRTFSLTNPYRLRKDSALQKLGLMRRYMVSYTEPVDRLVSEYLRVRPDVLYGIKSSLLDMALYSRQHSIAMPKPRFYVSAAETLDATSRRLLVETFGQGLAEVYGAVEFSTLAWRSAGDDVFRISHTTNVIEVAGSGPAAARDGSCIVTDLFIRSFPLIRYEIGDRIETDLMDGMRVIRNITGRANDWVIFPGGTRRTGEHFWAIIKRHPEIVQFRVIQESVDSLRLVLVRDCTKPVGDTQNAILRDLRKAFDDERMHYQFEWVERIPPDPNGKLRVLISEVAR